MGSLGKAVYQMGVWIRGAGQAMDRLGSRLQGSLSYQEYTSKHRTIMKLYDKAPDVASNAFVAPGASVIGDVKIGSGSSVWYGCSLRGDVNSIHVGSETNIQDNVTVHVASGNTNQPAKPTIIGNRVTIGHNALLHACTVEDGSFIGMGATLLDGVHVEKNAMVAAGSLVKQKSCIPTGEVWAGNPAKFLRKLSSEEIASFDKAAERYVKLADVHKEENVKTYKEIEDDKIIRKKWEVQSDDYDSHIGVSRSKAPPHVNARDPTLIV